MSEKSTRGSFLKERSFQVDVAAIFTALIMGAVLVVAFFTYWRNTRATLDISADLVKKVSDTAIGKATNYLAPAQTMSEVASRFVSEPGFRLLGNSTLEQYLITIVNAHPQFAMFYIGDEEGNFLMAARKADGTISTQIIDRSGGTRTWRHRDAEGHVIKTEPQKAPYDPRARPWYKQARKGNGAIWTDIYVFATGRKPGITAAMPAYGADGKLVGVVAADITLDALSGFLARQTIGKTGLAFIFNETGELVAYPDVNQTVHVDGDKVIPCKVGALPDRAVVRSYEEYRRTKKQQISFEMEGVPYLSYYTPFPDSFARNWTIAVVVPEDDFVYAIKETHRITLWISLVVLIVAIACAVLLSRSLSRPIELLTQETQKIKDFHLDDAPPIASHIREVQQIGQAIFAMKTGLKAFRRYVPADLVRELIQTGEEVGLGGHEKTVTLFFSDIKGFTTITEKLPPQDLVLHLSDYLEEMTQIIRAHGGTVDKYIGDGIMAFWGAPRECPEHARKACQAALACQKKLKQLNDRWQLEGKPELHTRIAIHTGVVTVGNMGSTERMNYTVIGDDVNLGGRMEALNKIYGTSCIVSRTTGQLVQDEFIMRPLDIVAVAGKSSEIEIYELMGSCGEEGGGSLQTKADAFARLLQLYQTRDWQGALQELERLHAEYGDDTLLTIYEERCRRCLADEPGQDWTPVVYMKDKL